MYKLLNQLVIIIAKQIRLGKYCHIDEAYDKLAEFLRLDKNTIKINYIINSNGNNNG